MGKITSAPPAFTRAAAFSLVGNPNGAQGPCSALDAASSRSLISVYSQAEIASILGAFQLNLTSGPVTASGNTSAIANGAISNAMLANGAVANLSGTNSGDNAVNSLYSGLVSNATHTGDATGDTALTVVRINGVALSGLATGILKNTTGTGVPSIAVAGDFPTLNQNTSGNAATVTTNANLTGPVTSVGNATAIAAGAISNAMLANAAVANLSGTNTGDNAINSLYSGLVSNANHTGDATGSTALTLATVNSNVGTFGSSTSAGSFTVNGKGLITAASAITVTPAVGSITGLGTGVAAALAIAVGSAGGPVTFNGALGTPSSGTLTNATGLPLAAGTTGTLAFGRGGTGLTSLGTGLQVLRTNGAANAMEWATISAGGGDMLASNNLSDLTNTTTARSNLGLGSLATQSGTFSGTSSGTNSGDNAVNSLYSGLITNATHTGDATGATALTLATVNSNVGAFGSATQAGTFTVNAKGLITAAAAVTVTPAIGSVTGLGTGVAAALAIAVGSAGGPVTFNGALGTPSSGTATNITGLPIVAGTTGTLSVARGGTNQSALGSPLQVLRTNGAGTDTEWATPSGGGGSVATDVIWDAVGDLAVGTGSDTAARLARGTALQVLRVNSGGTNIEWAAPGGAGATEVYVQDADPSPVAGAALWVQTNIGGDASKFTLWALTP